jgi:hypothetical protein
MTEDKIVNLIETVKQTSDEVFPITREVVLQRLLAIPLETAEAYVAIVSRQVEDTLFWKNIISAVGHPNQCKFLLEDLNQTQLDKLSSLALYLSIKPEEKTKEIQDLTFGIRVPSEENYSKAAKLMADLKTIINNHEDMAKRLADTSIHLKQLSQTVAALGLGIEYSDIILENLANLDDNSLDAQLDMVGKMRSKT